MKRKCFSPDDLYDCQKAKLDFRREFVYHQSRNYHYNKNYPTEFVKYLKLNREIHIRGLIYDGLMFVPLILGFFTFQVLSPIVFFLFTTVLSTKAIIDLECINLQNYNLCRFQNEKCRQS